MLLGGVGSTLGPVVGAAVVVCLPLTLGFSPTQNEIALGALFIAIILLLPDGIVGAIDRMLMRSRAGASISSQSP
jgi:ABC-type branched-subunit amino acid transport system permease subunit